MHGGVQRGEGMESGPPRGKSQIAIPDKKRNTPLRFSHLDILKTKMLVVMKFSFLIKSY